MCFQKIRALRCESGACLCLCLHVPTTTQNSCGRCWAVPQTASRGSPRPLATLALGSRSVGSLSFITIIIVCPGHHMYVDSVYVKHFQEVAKLTSPMTTAPMAGCLSFHYYRDQERGNVFSVYTRDHLGHYEEIWRPQVETTPSWTLVGVDIRAPHPLEVSGERCTPSQAELLAQPASSRQYASLGDSATVWSYLRCFSSSGFKLQKP